MSAFASRFHHSKVVWGCLLACTLLLTACGGNPPTTAPTAAPTAAPTPVVTGSKSFTAGGDTFVIGQTTDIKQLCPFQSTDTRSSLAIGLISEGLFRYTGHYVLEPCLAADFPEVSEDGLVWTFTLREGIFFHDGSPFTSEDVKFTYESIADPEQKSTQIREYLFIDRVETDGDYKVIFYLKQPYGPARNRFTMGIVSKTYIEAKGYNQNAYSRYNPFAVGTGPYKVIDWLPDIALFLEANEDYWGGAPALKKVEIRPIPDTSVRLAAFEVGEIDFIFGIDPAEVDRIMAQGNFECFNYPALGYNYLTWNTQIPLFQDLAFRQALSYATNRQEIIDYILYGHGLPAITLYTPNHPFYSDVGEPFPYDVEKAKTILAEAGYQMGADGVLINPDGDRCSFKTMIIDTSTINADIAVLLQARFAEIGVEIEIVKTTMDQLYDIMDAVIAGISPETDYYSMIGGMSMGADPDVTRTFHSDGSLNDFRYKNPELDLLLDEGVVTFDHEARMEVYRKIQEILANDLPCLWLYHGETNNAINPGFTGMEATPYGQVSNLRNVSRK